MQDTFLQVFVVALGLLVYPNNDPRIEEWDDTLTRGMQEHEQNLLREEEKFNGEMEMNGQGQDTKCKFLETGLDLHDAYRQEHSGDGMRPTSDNKMDAQVSLVEQGQDSHLQQELKSTEKAQINKATAKPVDLDYIWIIWKTFSLISFIHFFWKHGQRNCDVKTTFLLSDKPEDITMIDNRTLHIFHSQCIKVKNKKGIEDEFLDGFINDFVGSIQNVCSENGGMTIEKADLQDLHNVILPLTPPQPYFFKSLFCHQAEEVLLDTQFCGQIQLMRNEQKQIQNGCPCQVSGAADDMVCLLHNENDKVKTNHTFGEHLCKRGSNFLSKAEVGRWFQSTIRQAWSRISFKYEFEVSICSTSFPGALVVQFRSGEKIYFTMNPVIRFEGYSHFFITPCSPRNLDTSWSLSMSKYEDAFLNKIAKQLPSKACHIQALQIALFLHKKQTMLTGSSALKESHFKNALMHLVWTTDASEWKPDCLANRLHDIMAFMMNSIKTKQLHHILIGNPRAQDIIPLPKDFMQSDPVNLFYPLVAHKCIYKNIMTHFEELLKNAPMLINDYL